MSKIWEHDNWYTYLKPHVDWWTRRGYSHISVSGLENIPQEGAVIFAPNHSNSLMDALVVLQCQSRPTAFGARADIFKNRKVAAILRFLKIVPLARIRDGASAVTQNNAVFEEIIDIIGHGMPFCMYSEGTHHASHNVQPTLKGIWRVAFMALERLDMPVYLVPVGIDYEYFLRSSSPLDIRFGEPIDVAGMKDVGQVELNHMLHDRIQSLVSRKDKDGIDENGQFHYYHAPKKPLWRCVLQAIPALVTLPFFIIWTILSWPMELGAALLAKKMKDKTWTNTIRLAMRAIGLILLTLIDGILAFVFLKWYWALLVLVLLRWSDTAFNWHLNRYKDLYYSTAGR